MKTILKITENNKKHKASELEKSAKIVSFSNLFLLALTIINLMILTYFYIRHDIRFSATGWFTIPKNIQWYYMFLILIIVRLLIVFATRYLTEYIKKFSLWTEKEKKNRLNALAAINLLTIPINLPLLGGFYSYMKGNEIIADNSFLGTFRRILNENERETLYAETVQNFLDKIETSKVIKDKLKTFAFDNSKAILTKYDEGSALATENILKILEIKKKLLETEMIKTTINTTKNKQQFPSTIEKILEALNEALNCFNPFVTDYRTCALAWVALLGTGFLIYYGVSSNSTSLNEIKYNQQNSERALKETVARLGYQDETLKLLSMNNEINRNMLQRISEQQESIIRLSERIATVTSAFGPQRLPTPAAIHTRKHEILTNILPKYRNRVPSMETIQEMIREIIALF